MGGAVFGFLLEIIAAMRNFAQPDIKIDSGDAETLILNSV